MAAPYGNDLGTALWAAWHLDMFGQSRDALAILAIPFRAKNGADFGLLNGVGPGGAKLVPGQNVRVDIMEEHGLFSDAKKGQVRCSDPHLRLKDM